MVSLCGKPIDEVPPNGDAASLGLEYRFGRVSHVEFKFPSQETQPKPDHFFGEHLRLVGEGAVDSLSITFESKSVTYGVSVREGRDKFAGVWIADGKKYRELPCGTKANAGRFFGLALSLPPMK